MARLDDYFRQKTKNISFIEIKPGTFIDVNGFKVTEETPLPIVVDDLIEEVKENSDGEEIKFTSFINGMIYTLGVDPEFKFFEDYKKILYQYDEKIEDYILYKSLKNISEDNLELGMISLRALYFINDKNLFGKYNYALVLAERAKVSFELKDKDLGREFLDSSTEILEEVLDDDPNYALALYKLGYHYKSRSEFKKAQITWEKFLRTDEQQELLEEVRECLVSMSDDVIYEEGYSLVLEGYAAEGLEKLLSIEEKYDKWWNLYFMIGLAYRQLGKYKEAKGYFEKVLEIEQDQVDALNELGLTLVYLGDEQGGISNFSKALEHSPGDYEIMCNRGMTYLQINDLKRAEEDITKAYDLNPNDEITMTCMAELDKYL